MKISLNITIGGHLKFLGFPSLSRWTILSTFSSLSGLVATLLSSSGNPGWNYVVFLFFFRHKIFRFHSFYRPVKLIVMTLLESILKHLEVN